MQKFKQICIQDFEKIQMQANIKELDEILSAFKAENLNSTPAAEMVIKAKESLINFE